MKERMQSLVALILTALIITAGIVALRSCQVPRVVIPAIPSIAIATPKPSPSPELQAASKTTSSTTAAAHQKVKATVWFPLPESAKKPTSQEGQEGALNGLPGTSGPSEKWGKIEIELEQEISAVATSSGEASASIAPSKKEEKRDSLPLGVIAGTMPGMIALDYRALQLGPLGVDLEANHRQVGVGVSVGTKAFGVGGVYQGFDGGRGYFVGGGIRF